MLEIRTKNVLQGGATSTGVSVLQSFEDRGVVQPWTAGAFLFMLSLSQWGILRTKSNCPGLYSVIYLFWSKGVWVFCTAWVLCSCTVCICAWRLEENPGCPKISVTHNCEPLCKLWAPNSEAMQEQKILLTTESYFYLQVGIYWQVVLQDSIHDQLILSVWARRGTAHYIMWV